MKHIENVQHHGLQSVCRYEAMVRAQQPAFIVAPGLHLQVKAVGMPLLIGKFAADALVETLQSRGQPWCRASDVSQALAALPLWYAGAEAARADM